MQKLKILGTGLQGLVGSQLTELLQDRYEFTNISRSTGVDITNKEQVSAAVTQSDAPYLLHLAAKADVDGCEREKALSTSGEAWQIHVNGTQHLIDACKESGKTFLYISTDFVFDGRKDLVEKYSEDDTAIPINWYGYTKFQGEEVVRNSGIPYLVLRIAYPYGRPFDKKKDFIQAMLGRLTNGQPVAALTDHIFTPTYIPDIAAAIDCLIAKNIINETFHIVGSQSLSPFDAVHKIADKYELDHGLITATTRAEFFKDRAERPYNLSIKNDRIKQLGVEMKGFEEGLREIKN
jgi:dTDP-4-dehydrorhamnose reductase